MQLLLVLPVVNLSVSSCEICMNLVLGYVWFVYWNRLLRFSNRILVGHLMKMLSAIISFLFMSFWMVLFLASTFFFFVSFWTLIRQLCNDFLREVFLCQRELLGNF